MRNIAIYQDKIFMSTYDAAIVAIDGETSRSALVGDSRAAWDKAPRARPGARSAAAAAASRPVSGARNSWARARDIMTDEHTLWSLLSL